MGACIGVGVGTVRKSIEEDYFAQGWCLEKTAGSAQKGWFPGGCFPQLNRPALLVAPPESRWKGVGLQGSFVDKRTRAVHRY